MWFCWLVGFHGISTFVGYLTPNLFFIQIVSSMSNYSVHSLIVKNISISNYSVYSNSSNSANFVYTLLNVKTVLYTTIQFRVSTVLMSKTVPF